MVDIIRYKENRLVRGDNIQGYPEDIEKAILVGSEVLVGLSNGGVYRENEQLYRFRSPVTALHHGANGLWAAAGLDVVNILGDEVRPGSLHNIYWNYEKITALHASELNGRPVLFAGSDHGRLILADEELRELNVDGRRTQFSVVGAAEIKKIMENGNIYFGAERLYVLGKNDADLCNIEAFGGELSDFTVIDSGIVTASEYGVWCLRNSGEEKWGESGAMKTVGRLEDKVVVHYEDNKFVLFNQSGEELEKGKAIGTLVLG
ncbi:MAG: hypothetical protein ACE5FT_00240 [Candidatus Nanoarchaeia archaeon]